MSRKLLSTYTAFQRNILAEFMREQELKELDKLYNKAKVNRFLKYKEKRYSQLNKYITRIFEILDKGDNITKEEFETQVKDILKDAIDHRE